MIGGVTPVVIEVEDQDRAKAQDRFCPPQSMPMATEDAATMLARVSKEGRVHAAG